MNVRECTGRQIWRVYSKVYDALLDLMPYKKLVSEVASRVPTCPGRVAELGCGTGNVLSAIITKRKGCVDDLIGVDSSAEMLEVAAVKLPEVTLVLDGALNFLDRQGDGTFEAIVLQNSLYAFPDRQLVLDAAARVLRNGGVLIISDPISPAMSPIISEHLREGSWRSLMSPRFAVVGTVNLIINALNMNGTYAYSTPSEVGRMLAQHFVIEEQSICYAGTNVLFVARRSVAAE